MKNAPLHDAIVDAWGASIVSGERPAGSVLNADQAAIEFDASRTAVREAVRVLESLGLVKSRQRVGMIVQPDTEWSTYDERVLGWLLDGSSRGTYLNHLSELRAGVEPMAAFLAASRASAADRAALTAAVLGMIENSDDADGDAYLGHDIDFHRALLRASGNPMFRELESIVSAVLLGRTHHALMPHVADPAALKAHSDIAAAVMAGDAAAAEAAMRSIVAESVRAMRAAEVTA